MFTTVNQGVAGSSPAGGAGEEGDQGNAFRHVLWQSILTNEFGSEEAMRIGNNHEDNLPSNMSQRKFDYMGDADQMADLLNNRIGREIGRKKDGASNKDLAIATLNEYRENGLWQVTGNEETGFKVERKTMSEEQYRKALEVIESKGDDGLSK